ncbi:MAG: NUDIX domain-containing protein [Chromatiales bacterium]|jgi:ADP-ribose pyrophosphatase YjhB (NUDIX family)
MADLIPAIRNAARALIIREQKVLLLRKQYETGLQRYTLPGGGQDVGESLQQALQRECLEEIGTSVEIGTLLHVADFFKLKDTQPPTRRHLVEFVFECKITADYQPQNGHRPDKHQVEVIWANLHEAAQLPLYPQFLSTCMTHQQGERRPHYLGVFHDHATA